MSAANVIGVHAFEKAATEAIHVQALRLKY